MGFQKKAYVSQAVGKPGQKSRDLPDHHLPKIVEGHDLKEGAFAFAGTSPEQVKGTALAGTSPIGFAALQRYQANLTGGNTMTINEGEEVAVYLEGYFFAKTGTAAKGDKVLVDPLTGDLGAGANATSATAGTLTFEDVDYTDFTSISAGTATFVVDGEEHALTGLDFSSATSLSDVASVFDTALTGVADCAASSGDLVFTSATTGASSKVALTSTGTVETALGTGVAVDGKNAFIDSGWVVETASDVNGIAEIHK